MMPFIRPSKIDGRLKRIIRQPSTTPPKARRGFAVLLM
jgi:hypothetical protein